MQSEVIYMQAEIFFIFLVSDPIRVNKQVSSLTSRQLMV